MRLQITSHKIGRAYSAIVIALLAMQLLTWAVAAAGYPGQYGIRALFDFDTEASIPAMFAAISLMTCGLLLAAVYARCRANERPHCWRWALLALVFVFLAADEAVSIHEKISEVINRFVKGDGILSYVWVVPYGIAAMAGIVLYWPWICDLPRSIRLRLILAAVLYLGGAIGLEMVGAWLWDNELRQSHWYTLEVTIEELCELVGVGVFICALIDYLRLLNARVLLDFDEGDSPPAH